MTIKQIRSIDIQNYDIIFYEDTHSYINTKLNKKLPSVTTILSKYKKPFNSNYWSNVKAVQRGITQDEILKEWDDSKMVGSTTGTLLHNFMEAAAKNKICSLQDEKNNEWSKSINDRLSLLKTFVLDLLKHFRFNEKIIPIGCEAIIGNELYAGQVDGFGFNTETGRYYLWDYKTDNEFSTESKYKYQGTLSHLQDTKLNKYSLQLSMYLYDICTRMKINPKNVDMEIIWINENNESYIIVPVTYMKKEVELIIKDLEFTL